MFCSGSTQTVIKHSFLGGGEGGEGEGRGEEELEFCPPLLAPSNHQMGLKLKKKHNLQQNMTTFIILLTFK